MRNKKKLVLNYNVIFQEEESGGYSVWVPDLPGCASQGETFDKAKENIKEAMELYLEDATVSSVQPALGQLKQFFVPVSVPVYFANG